MSTTEIKSDIVSLSKTLKGKITIGDNGVATVEPGTYVALLPEGISEDNVKQLQSFHSELAAAATLATGELAVPYMKKNKTVTQVELSIPMVGKDALDVTIKREKTVINPTNKEQSSTVYGAATAGFTVYSTRPRGEMAKVKSHLAELAMKALG
jgi:hypothetical protein